jgi:hypothetical protein
VSRVFAENSMIFNGSDKLRRDYRVYLEPLLATACGHQAGKCGARTMSKYIRYSVIRALIQDGYPLDKMSNKFNAFYKGVSPCR